MRDDVQFPKHILVGVGNGEQVLWRIMRNSDMKVCAMERTYVTDDGLEVSREPRIREWLNSDAAAAYMTRIEDGTAGMDPDSPVVWVDLVPFLTRADPMLVDGPL